MGMNEPDLRDRVAGSHWAVWIKPTIDYITRLAELIVLASAFSVAASKTDSIVLDGLAGILRITCAAYAGFAFGILSLAVDRIKTDKLWLALLIAIPLGLAMGVTAFEGSKALAEAINQLAGLDNNG